MKELLSRVYYGNSVFSYCNSLLFFLIGSISLRMMKKIGGKKLEDFSKKTKTSLDDFFIVLFNRVLFPFFFFGIVFLSLLILDFGPSFRHVLNIVGIAVLTFSSARFATLFSEYGFKVYFRKRGAEQAFVDSLQGIIRMVNFIIWTLAVIFFFDNLGFKVTAVIAGLGVGGVAVALAAQAVLGDLFSYFAILFDRPFEIGDFIIIGDYMGVVEHVGIKTTRISSLGGEQLIFSNSDLTNSRVRNYKRMTKRRVVFRLGVVYQTSLAVLKEIPGKVEGIIKSIDDTIFDRAHFFSYGNSSLDFEIVYYVQGGDYNKYMDIQQKINLGIKEAFEAESIEFAYPTQTIYINKEESGHV